MRFTFAGQMTLLSFGLAMWQLMFDGPGWGAAASSVAFLLWATAAWREGPP